MQELLNSPEIRVWLGSIRAWGEANLMGTHSLSQLGVIIGSVLAG